MTWVRVLRRRMTPGFAPASTFKRPLNSGRAYSADTFCISNCASRNFKQPFFCEMSVTPTLPASARSSATCTSVYTLGGGSPKRSMTSSMRSSASASVRTSAMRR